MVSIISRILPKWSVKVQRTTDVVVSKGNVGDGWGSGVGEVGVEDFADPDVAITVGVLHDWMVCHFSMVEWYSCCVTFFKRFR